ncbi:hypothetical protein PybrP1_004880 [[Pythium] brassicae (nom. inval.)]|nr:hypothetical protein PybrP1_004880 [[Pythium] brassicae (nom. inval.)]
MADVVGDTIVGGVRSALEEELVTPPTTVAAAERDESSPQPSTELDDDDDDNREDANPLLADQVLAVVVTSVDAAPSAPSGVVSAASSALLLRGAQEDHIVELVVTRRAGSHCVRRSLAELVSVLQPLACGAAPEFPMRQRGDDALVAKWCGDMTRFLADQASVLCDVPKWVEFIEESGQGKGSRAHMTAIEFILQPFQYEKKKEQFIVWKFDLEEHDIDFTVAFSVDPEWASMQASGLVAAGADGDGALLHTVHARTRYLATTTGRPIEALLISSLVSPSTRSWLTTPGMGGWFLSHRVLSSRKNILYQVQVVSEEIMESATAAADALDEALKAKKKERDDALTAALSTALIVSPQHPLTEPEAPSLYASFLPEALMQQSWIVSTPMNVAGMLASRLFGTPPTEQGSSPIEDSADGGDEEPKDGDELPSQRGDSGQGKSLLEELNGLNMQLLERLENLEDKVVKLTVERDQERSKTHMAVVDKENTMAQVKVRELEVESLRNELQRMTREREAWREIQSERDALLEEKHRWAMADDFADDRAEEEEAVSRSDLDSELRSRLEHELGQAEAAVLRLRAELGYSLTNHLTGTSTRLEKIAREMTDAKKQFEEQVKHSEHETVQLKQLLVKFRCQKKVLVTEIRNMKAQTEGQVAVAMAEASEARMVNRRLKKQNELLLTQIRALVGDARSAERQLAEQQEQLALLRSRPPEDAALSQEAVAATESSGAAATSGSSAVEDPAEQEPASDVMGDDESTVPYTLTAAHIALLNGQAPSVAAAPVASAVRGERSNGVHATGAVSDNDNDDDDDDAAAAPNGFREPQFAFNPHRARLVAFLRAKDPSLLPEVEEMLRSYRGVESSLFDSLELKYSLMALTE